MFVTEAETHAIVPVRIMSTIIPMASSKNLRRWNRLRKPTAKEVQDRPFHETKIEPMGPTNQPNPGFPKAMTLKGQPKYSDR
jgi:hypothetical protein